MLSQAPYAYSGGYIGYIGANFGGAISNKIGNYSLFQDDDGRDIFLKGKNIGALFANIVCGNDFFNGFGIEWEVSVFVPKNHDIRHVKNDSTGQSFKLTQKMDPISATFSNIFAKMRVTESVCMQLVTGIGASSYKLGRMIVEESNGSPFISHEQQKYPTVCVAWNAGWNLQYSLTESISLNLISYRYYSLGTFSTQKNPEDNSILSADIGMHQFSTGLIIEF